MRGTAGILDRLRTAHHAKELETGDTSWRACDLACVAAKKATKAARVTVRLDLTIPCGRCMRPVVIEDLAGRVACGSCLHERALTEGDWAYMAEQEVAKAMRGARTLATMQNNFGEYPVRVRVGPAPLACACGAAVDEEAALAALDSEVPCACGRGVRVRSPDGLALAVAAKTLAVVTARPRAFVPAEPVAFRCACSASLRTDGATRSVACATCGSVDVPEALFAALRPVTERAPMFLVIAKGR